MNLPHRTSQHELQIHLPPAQTHTITHTDTFMPGLEWVAGVLIGLGLVSDLPLATRANSRFAAAGQLRLQLQQQRLRATREVDNTFEMCREFS